MSIYEYLFTALIIIALVLGSSAMVVTFPSPASNASDRDQLKAAAEKLMTQILLDPGYPYDWGASNTPYQNLLAFGLAKYAQTSRQAYELDPDKVLRLNSTLQGSSYYFVPPSTASDLLGLGHDYGFTLEFNQTLQTTATRVPNTNKYTIKVTSEYSLPVIAANVSAVLYSMSGSNIVSSGARFNRTTYDGTCLLNFEGSYGSSRALAVTVNYYGVQATSILAAESAVSASLLGDNIILRSGSVPSLTDVREVIVIHGSNGTEFRDFSVGYTLNSPNFLLNSFPEPSAVAVLAVADKKSVFIAQRDFSKISYRTIPAIRSSSMSYSLERTVLIGGSTFSVTLYLWRMSY